MTKIVQLNIGGMRYDVVEDILMKHEDTMLAKLISGKLKEGNNTETLFIDRNGERFQYILDWYRDGKITVPKTITVEAIKSETLFFGLPTDAIIEETQPIYDYASSLDDAVQRSKRLRLHLEEVTKRNRADYIAISIKDFAVWVINQMLNRTTLTGIPSVVSIHLGAYKKIDTQFLINDSQKDALLVTMKEIFATIGDELRPAFLTSLDIKCGLGGKFTNLNFVTVTLKFSHYLCSTITDRSPLPPSYTDLRGGWTGQNWIKVTGNIPTIHR
jgi:hypothetical protein